MALRQRGTMLAALLVALLFAAFFASPAIAPSPPRFVTPPCAAEQLSCGKQRPVLSDGVRRFENEELGLSVLFPRGSEVCLARSGDAPRGFFAVYPGGGCEERPLRPPRAISVYGSYNALSEESVEAAAGDCGAVSPALRFALPAEGLAIPGEHSLMCQTPAADGAIELSVHALAGPWQDGVDGRPRTRQMIFFAALITLPDRLDEDLARFRALLASIRINPAR
jgi:hypothetical protein